jgi:peptidoglycan/LPS O-acetylase OafA/YrhL
MYATLVGLWLVFFFSGAHRVKAFARSIIALAALALIVQFADHFYFRSGNDFYRLFYMFFTGAACCVLKEHIDLSWRLFAPLFAGLVVSALHREAFFVFYSLSLAYLLLWLAYAPGGALRKFNQLGDYSYGVYIYAFPIQQSLVALFPGISIPVMTLAATVATLVFATASWHLIEKRALALRSKVIGSSRRALEGAGTG